MIICPNCSHENPDGAEYCDSCYTPLPIITISTCPSCGGTVQSDASFCGSCGFNLKSASQSIKNMPEETENTSSLHEEESLPVPNLSEADLNELIEPVAVEPNPRTQLQQLGAFLIHVQTNIKLELPTNLQVIHIGKPNNMIPPDIDVSGFPDSDIVSRVHADIRFEGNAFYFEDTGSSNGTYVNNVALPAGNRHKLRAGDRIALGKGDRVSFIFQES
ncbi:FHA domain-containing protein [Synechococcus sp. PCC 7502]|uniref:FHA domain-containing protein n=1 Tax=Synechococcus sp. PCC 7502 TaxID=1173263 RepID=UPI00029FA179|nr:FHA domain-containing protein [Synechococcus sp. PCC 7502]AFY72643.1 FHA domain-containing protein [Synechococcus sp. PCC 7502]